MFLLLAILHGAFKTQLLCCFEEGEDEKQFLTLYSRLTEFIAFKRYFQFTNTNDCDFLEFFLCIGLCRIWVKRKLKSAKQLDAYILSILRPVQSFT